MKIGDGLDVMLFFYICRWCNREAISLMLQRFPVRISAMAMDDVKENSLFDLIFNFHNLPNIFKLFFIEDKASNGNRLSKGPQKLNSFTLDTFGSIISNKKGKKNKWKIVMLRAKIWTFSKNLVISASKYRHFRDFIRTALESFESGLAMAAIVDKSPHWCLTITLIVKNNLNPRLILIVLFRTCSGNATENSKNIRRLCHQVDCKKQY